MDRSISTIVLGYHTWKSPPSDEQGDYRTLQGLASRLGGQMHVFVVSKTEERRYSSPNGVVFHFIRSRGGPASYCVKTFLRSRAVLSALPRPAVIVSSEVVSGLVGLLLAKVTRVPFLAQVQGHVLHPGEEYGSIPRRTVIGFVMRRVARHASAVRCVSEPIAQEAKALKPKGLVAVVGTRADTLLFRPGERQLQSNPMTDEPLTLVSVGSLVPRKNLVTLIRGLAEAEQKHPGLHLIIVGEGAQRLELGSMVREAGLDKAVAFQGSVSHEQLAGILRQADIYVHPSSSEGQPRAVLEALATGLPVIASRIPALTEVLTDRENGVLVPPFDASSWARAILELTGDPGLRRRLGAAGRLLVEARYDFEASLDNFASLIASTSR
jgi:glycosyltransferase involved in cell wall biosynthesis